MTIKELKQFVRPDANVAVHKYCEDEDLYYGEARNIPADLLGELINDVDVDFYNNDVMTIELIEED